MTTTTTNIPFSRKKTRHNYDLQLTSKTADSKTILISNRISVQGALATLSHMELSVSTNHEFPTMQAAEHLGYLESSECQRKCEYSPAWCGFVGSRAAAALNALSAVSLSPRASHKKVANRPSTSWSAGSARIARWKYSSALTIDHKTHTQKTKSENSTDRKKILQT